MTDLSLKNDQNTLTFTFWSINESQFSNLEIPFVEKEGKIILLPKQ